MFKVLDAESKISVRFFDSKKEAREYAKFLTSYHNHPYIVTEAE